MITIVRIFFQIPQAISIGIVRGYRVLLSPDSGIPRFLGMSKGDTCGFYPTCSAYAEESLAKYGFFKGWALAIRRIARCHPWSDPKIDKVP